MRPARTAVRHYLVALRSMLVLMVGLAIIYPLVVTGIGQLALPWQANGSWLHKDGKPVGSALIAQSFTDAEGEALPEWFQPRPSAADFDGGSSAASNFGPENPEFVDTIAERRATIAEREGVSPARIPVDALTASSSGLDPHISPEYAELQIDRVAAERGLEVSEVRELVRTQVQGRDLGYLGEPTVNVMRLNLALSELD